MYDFIIRKPTIIDGSGETPYLADVGVVNGEIVEIAEDIPVKTASVVLAEGLILSPGFIDVQNHSDSYWCLFDEPGLESLLLQGYTSVLVGNCGASLAPLLSPDAIKSSQKWHDLSGANINWRTFAEFADTLSQQKLGINVGSMVGYGTLRRGLMGNVRRSLTSDETSVLASELSKSIKEGAFGLSCGLGYSHEIHVSEIELFEMAKVVAKHNALLSVHLRNEAEGLATSVEEALDIASRSGVNLKLSHFKVCGEQNWSILRQVLDRVEDAVHRGTEVTLDVYPFESTWKPLYTYLPKWSLDGGRLYMLKVLEDELQTKKIISYLHNTGVKFANMVVASSSYNLRVVGKTLGQIANNMGMSSEEAIVELLRHGGSEVLVFDQSLSKSQVDELLLHPLSVVATDGGGFSGRYASMYPSKLVHPRCFSTSVEFLLRSKANSRLAIEKAISKLTLRPATVWGLSNRGRIGVGFMADMVLLDPQKLKNKATMQNPFRNPEGIEKVWVNGRLAVSDGKMTSARAGQMLRKK